MVWTFPTGGRELHGMYSGEIVNQQALPPALGFLEHNDHFIVKPDPIPPLFPMVSRCALPTLLAIRVRRALSRTGPTANARPNFHTPAPYPAGPPLEFPHAHLAAARADAYRFAPCGDLGVTDARGVAPEAYSGGDGEGGGGGGAEVEDEGVVGEGGEEVWVRVA